MWAFPLKKITKIYISRIPVASIMLAANVMYVFEWEVQCLHCVIILFISNSFNHDHDLRMYINIVIKHNWCTHIKRWYIKTVEMFCLFYQNKLFVVILNIIFFWNSMVFGNLQYLFCKEAMCCQLHIPLSMLRLRISTCLHVLPFGSSWPVMGLVLFLIL